MRDECKRNKDKVLLLDDQIRQLKIKSSEKVAMSVESQNKAFRAGYESRLQKVSLIFLLYALNYNLFLSV